MSCPILTQDPLDTRLVTVDFSDWLDTGVSILSVSWSIDSDLTESGSSATSTAVSNYISGGSDGEDYECSVSITTDEATARVKTQRFIIRVLAGCS